MKNRSKSFTLSTQVIIVGAGPVGLELAAALKQAGVDYLQFDAGQIGHTISWWPKATHFFSTPERIAIAGVRLQTADPFRATNEEYLAYLRGVVEQFDLPVHTYEAVTAIEKLPDGFIVRTHTRLGEQEYTCRQVVLATGSMAAPNLLGIPGEDLPHVTHYFQDAHIYFQQRLVVVGGRNSALEAAMRCWRAGAKVTISHRKASPDRADIKNFLLEDFDTRLREGAIEFLPNTIPVEITPECVVLAHTTGDSELFQVPADFVILATGYAADPSLFAMLGVDLQGAELAPVVDPDSMETNVPGVYVAGTAVGGSQKHYQFFIETSHKDIPKIVQSILKRR
jgi:thioredoxin reductase (NADPH)